jgi:putative ABC transport system substrate-binding protein
MGQKNHNRRALLAALLASTLAPAASLAARERVFVIGHLFGGPIPGVNIAGALADLGYVEGRNLRFELRTPASWEPATLAAAAAELVATKPDVLVAMLFWPVHALAAATRSIPIVSMGTPDPVGEGLVQSLRRPGGNVTGLSLGLRESAEATMHLLRRMRPSLRRVAMLHAVDPLPSFFAPAARAAGLEPAYIRIGDASDADRLLRPFAGEAAFITPMKDRGMMGRIAKTARGMQIAFIAPIDDAVMDYSFDFTDGNRRVAAIIDKVLRGANPGEIPLELPERPNFMLNRRIARELGMEIPNDVLLRVTDLVD